MEDMATGFALWPTPEHQLDKDFSFKDSEWLMLLIVAMFGGDEFRNAMMDAAMEKAKEVVERGKQLVPESAPAADEPAE
jgi:hypothetical protein